MVITDRLSKSVIFEVMASITAEAVAGRLLNSFIVITALLLAIVSDRGPQFVGHIWKRICDLLKITRRAYPRHYLPRDRRRNGTGQSSGRALPALITSTHL